MTVVDCHIPLKRLNLCPLCIINWRSIISLKATDCTAYPISLKVTKKIKCLSLEQYINKVDFVFTPTQTGLIVFTTFIDWYVQYHRKWFSLV